LSLHPKSPFRGEWGGVLDDVFPVFRDPLCPPISIIGSHPANSLSGIYLQLGEWMGTIHQDDAHR
jgi:hypothetical protein